MKKKTIITVLAVIMTAVTLAGCSEKSRELNDLYEITDGYVEELNTRYSFPTLYLYENPEKSYTKKSTYRVLPIGRLINVRIERYGATSEQYRELRDKLAKHYLDNPSVRDVYICNAGTVMVDCRR